MGFPPENFENLTLIGAFWDIAEQYLKVNLGNLDYICNSGILGFKVMWDAWALMRLFL